MNQNDTNFDINQRFGFLNDLASMVVCGVTPSLIVTGEGGLGKTHSVTKTIENNDLETAEYVFFKGYSTARGLYNTLFDNNGKLIIFDDCDEGAARSKNQGVCRYDQAIAQGNLHGNFDIGTRHQRIVLVGDFNIDL